jgi:iron complex outermembrane receptor protein
VVTSETVRRFRQPTPGVTTGRDKADPQTAAVEGTREWRAVTRIAAVALAGLLLSSARGLAQSRPRSLSEVSIEDLMGIEIISASRHEQRTADVAAAVFVITQEDIRRSAMTTLPDLLRLAPGVNVAQINANKWAVSVRGFNGLYSNKLLILIDGRNAYNRLLAGVLWDVVDPVLDDIERIEVVRGPGAAMWGANAVNGVINIVTKTAADTRGLMVNGGAGRVGEQAAVRYGGTAGSASYRVYSQWTHREESVIAPGLGANDTSRNVSAGFRTDWGTQLNAFTVEGDLTVGHGVALWPNLDPQTVVSQPFDDDLSHTRNGNLLGRWTHTRANGAALKIQSFVDVASRDEPVGDFGHRTFDIDTQYHTALGARHDLVGGVGYRYSQSRFSGDVGFSLDPPRNQSSLLTAFLQDEIAVPSRRLALTLGTQVQYDSYSGGGFQPAARIMWTPVPHQRLWAATSRALRTPSLYERGIRVEFPAVPGPDGLPLAVTALGNPSMGTESFTDVEAGYRLEVGSTASLDITGFIGFYRALRTREPTAVVTFVPSPRVLVTTRFDNQLRARTQGVEVAAHWTPIPAWRLDASYTGFDLRPELAATSLDVESRSEDGTAPRGQWQLRAVWSFAPGATFYAGIFRVGALEQLQVDGYTRVDANLEWQLTRQLTAMVIGQNLSEAAHIEFGGAGPLLRTTQVPRSAALRLRWTFR